MEILKLKPAYKDYLWGGTRLKTEYNKDFPGDRLAESWELSCHPDGPSIVADGPFAGRTLREYVAAMGKRVLGSNCQIFQDFPILIKLIDAKENLSIQVHPNNVDALEKEGQYGKTEMWYVLEAEPDAFLYYGFSHEISKREFRERIDNGTLTEALNAVPVKKGDLFYIPAGTVHAICKGIVVAEVQQSSNVTYRVYDYGRLDSEGKPRCLHVDRAVEVARREPPRTDYDFGGHLARCAYFTVDLIRAPYRGSSDDESFTSLLALDGEGTIRNANAAIGFRKGDSLFIPADAGDFSVEGKAEILMTRVGTI